MRIIKIPKNLNYVIWIQNYTIHEFPIGATVDTNWIFAIMALQQGH